MHIITGDRCTGKTQALVDWVMEAPEQRIVVVTNWKLQGDLRQRLASAGHENPRAAAVLARDCLIGALRGLPPGTEVAIDNLDLLLHELLLPGAPIVAATMGEVTVQNLSPAPDGNG